MSSRSKSISGIMRGGDLGKLAHREHVLDQAADPAVMDGLGGGRRAIGQRDGFVREDGFEQRLQVRVGHRGDPALELREHFVAVAFGGGQEIGDIDLGLREQLQAVDGELRLVLEQLHHALDLEEAIALEGVHHLRDVVPHLGVEVAGAIRQGQRKIGLAGLLLANFFVLDEKHALHELIGFQLGNIRSLHCSWPGASGGGLSATTRCRYSACWCRGWAPRPANGACAAWRPPVPW